MANIPVISLQEAIESLNRRPGIVVGPNATCLPGILPRIFINAFKKFEKDLNLNGPVTDITYRANLDVLAQIIPDQLPTVERQIRDELLKLSASLDLPHLAKAGWSACISLTEDVLFEAGLRNYLDEKPTSVTSTIIDHSAVMPPERTIPVYKLLGNINNSDPDRTLAITESGMLVRQQTWPQLLRTFPDYLKEAPLFFVGAESVTPLVRSLLGVLLGMPRPNVSKFLFLKDDATIKDPTIMALCSLRNVAVIDATLRDFCNAIGELKPMQSTSSIAGATILKQDELSKALSPYENIVSLVPSGRLDDATIALQLPKLIDGLFRPASIDWRPFIAKLDLRRTCTDEIKNSILDLFDTPVSAPKKALVVHGEAGIGKTLLLKRVAVELASDGIKVIWCRRSIAGNYVRAYRELARMMAETAKENQQENYRFVLLCDDPWSLRLDASEILTCFDQFPGKFVVVFAVRNSDYFANDNAASINGLSRTIEFEVPYELDPHELADIGAMLLRIGAVKNAEEAQIEVQKLSKRDAADILCSLWYLVPETRSQLTESLRDEYCRLGSIKDSITEIVGNVSSSAVAHKAYEFVTVMSNLDIGLPIEVLVRALQVDYKEWLDMMVDGRPLWGLLYDEIDQESGTVLFRTRNSIVTYVLLDLVNGGVGHTGEVRVLKELLRSCNVGSIVYRTFVLDVLVRAKAKLAKILTYEEGLELFDIAREALPHSDRVIEHHRGIWMHDKGHDYRNAYAQFESALLCDLYPGAERDAPQAHIHTSMAAAVVQMVKQGTQDKASGLELVRQHLRQATNTAYFDSHTAHISANLLFELAMQGGGGTKDNVSLSSLSEALQEIEKAFQNIGSHVRGYSKHEKSLGMLLNLQRKILGAIPDVEQLKKLALENFETSGAQVGFEVAARRMLIEANETGKGKNYNDLSLYLKECEALIASKQSPLSTDLLSTRIDLTIRWKIQRHGMVDWEAFKLNLEELLKSPSYSDNAIKQFYYAVALFQCGKLTDANASFAGLRRNHSSSYSLAPREIRSCYQNENGDPKRFQCEIEREHQLWYVRISELNQTIPARPPGTVGGKGATVHAYIGFTLNGPLAVFNTPGDTDLLLP